MSSDKIVQIAIGDPNRSTEPMRCQFFLIDRSSHGARRNCEKIRSILDRVKFLFALFGPAFLVVSTTLRLESLFPLIHYRAPSLAPSPFVGLQRNWTRYKVRRFRFEELCRNESSSMVFGSSAVSGATPVQDNFFGRP